MHARRYFMKALDAGDARAALPLAAFKKLYEIEATIRDARGRRRPRRRRSEEPSRSTTSSSRWCETLQAARAAGSPIGEAIQYLTNHQVALRRFLERRRLPIDNGIVERLHVRAALTRKNYLFAGSRRRRRARGDRLHHPRLAAACADVNPVEYLADVLPRLARRVRLADIPAMMPAAWKAARAATPDAAATLPTPAVN